ncbi:MAG: protein kinase domain-containing protein [Candidatus Eiseniibacteriota bacterium]
MTDRWERIAEILEHALEQPAELREAYIIAACAGDESLHAEVLSLLRHSAASEHFLEPGHSQIQPVDLEGAAPPSLGPGSVIGAWRLERQIGEGGMGAVWLAARVEGQFTQRGALKLIRLGLAFEEAIRRFRRERQILASLDDPHIARLLDGGSTAEGLPYLVMEYVEGEMLYGYCATNALPLEARLELFLDLCTAVHSAHQKLVVHRDLKPGNVMVTADGTLKLLDFGVAKIFEPDSADGASLLRTTELPFTPLYASPDQLRGGEVGTTSDVYSLGVLLFELLTGAHPYPGASGSVTDVIRVVLDQEPTRPSAASAPAAEGASDASRLPPPPIGDARARSRRLAGDLDTIVLKAMAKDPARRYASAERLAGDVRRFLEGRPIEARPDSWSYRTAKFVRRNRLTVAAAAAGALALLIGLGVSVRETAFARHEGTLAERRLRDVQALANTLMFDVYDGIENMPGATAVRRSVIEKTSTYLDALAQSAGRDSSVRFSLADAYLRLGITQRNADMPGDVAARSSERSFAACRELLEGLLRDHPDSEHALLSLIQVYSRLGNSDEIVGRLGDALDMMTRAEAAQLKLIARHPGNAGYVAGLPRRQNNLGLALYYNDRIPEAAAKLRQASEGYAALAARDSSDWQSRRLLAMTLTVYGDCLQEQPAWADSALIVERRALALYDSLSKRRPTDLDLRLRVADGHERLAQMYALHLGIPDSGLVHINLAQRMVETVAASDPSDHSLAIDAMDGRVTRALVLAATGHVDEAARVIAVTAPIYEKWAAADTSDSHFKSGLPELYLAMAVVDLDHARSSSAASANAAWQKARGSFGRARRAYGFDLAGTPPSGLTGDLDRWIRRGTAQCDSALAAPPVQAARPRA